MQAVYSLHDTTHTADEAQDMCLTVFTVNYHPLIQQPNILTISSHKHIV